MTYERTTKRALDVLGSLIAIAFATPFLVLISLAILVDDGRPILFRQRRVGANGGLFNITKFRTYPTDAPELDSSAATALEPTRFGRLLRRTSLDELPQFTNVLSGDMSLVGPRPALPSQHELLELRAACGASRLRPGMTGLAQVESYDGMTATAKAEFDCQYSQRVTVRTDAALLLKTVKYVLAEPPTY
jgi:O-antigen biosynthesis protein WbqP